MHAALSQIPNWCIDDLHHNDQVLGEEFEFPIDIKYPERSSSFGLHHVDYISLLTHEATSVSILHLLEDLYRVNTY